MSLDSKVKAGITVEFLASSADLPPAHRWHPDGSDGSRDIGARHPVGESRTQRASRRTRLDSLDFHALAINTAPLRTPR